MNRSKDREILMQAVFQMEAQNDTSMNTLTLLTKEYPGADLDYIVSGFKIVTENLEDIDNTIDTYSKWNVRRLSKTDLAILRVAVSEMKYNEDIPTSVAINEAVNLAKEFSADEAPAFVNGVLGKIAKELGA